MKFLTAFTGLLSLAAAIYVPGAEDESPDDLAKKGCARGVHVVAVGGKGTTVGDMGYLESLAWNVTGKIPHSDLKQIAYPPGAEGPEAVAYAIPRLRQHIKAYAKGCPKTPMALVSYSVGGMAMMNTICGDARTGLDRLPKKYAKHVVANVVYGDLTYRSGLSYDRGSCRHKAGLIPRAKPGHCFPFGRKTRSYCDAGDENCCSGKKFDVHFQYPRKYDAKASDWIKKRWLRWRKNH